jgi:hypothetical protein
MLKGTFQVQRKLFDHNKLNVVAFEIEIRLRNDKERVTCLAL